MRRIALVVLAEANAVLDFGLFSADRSDGFIELLFFVEVGTVLIQILPLAVWFTCMEGSLGWRFGVPLLVTALIGYAAAIGGVFDPMAMVVLPLTFQFPLFGIVAVLWPVCRTRGVFFVSLGACSISGSYAVLVPAGLRILQSWSPAFHGSGICLNW
jgi:hypothetical protein